MEVQPYDDILELLNENAFIDISNFLVDEPTVINTTTTPESSSASNSTTTSPATSPEQLMSSPEPCSPQQEDVKEVIEVFLKAAKGREDQYSANFATAMLCSPYKYDIRILGTLHGDISIYLVDAETLAPAQHPTKPTAITVDNITKCSIRERVVRFSIGLTSFHCNRRQFRIALACQGTFFYYSTPFTSYARRREQHFSNSSPYSRPAAVATTPQVPSSAMPKPSAVTPATPVIQFLPMPAMPATNNFVLPMQPQQQQPQFPVVTANEQSRVSLAIELLKSLTPRERQVVCCYLSGATGVC